MKNLTVGYTLPQALTSGIGISNLRIYVSGENLMEWSALKDYFDPEAVNDAIQYNPAVSQSRGVGKGYSYPFQRRYVVGVNIGF
ncbi:MAG: TonB-dependent receptor [Roseivirga sp.]|nr:TonB-dependent receptor [Roseivirga sp.]